MLLKASQVVDMYDMYCPSTTLEVRLNAEIVMGLVVQNKDEITVQVDALEQEFALNLLKQAGYIVEVQGPGRISVRA